MTAPTIDIATFEALQQTAGSQFVGELVDTFLEEAPGMLANLRQALAAGNADQFRRCAHSLKSNSLTFGASTLGAMARELELGGQGPVLAAKGAPLDALDLEYSRVAAALADLRDA